MKSHCAQENRSLRGLKKLILNRRLTLFGSGTPKGVLIAQSMHGTGFY